MTFSHAQKLEATIRGPMGRGLWRPDTRIVERDGWYQVITPSASRGSLNEIVSSRVAESEADRVIEDVIRAQREIGQPVKWCVGPWTTPADFGERLTRRGFRGWDVRGMACDTTRVLPIAEGVTWIEVDETTLEDYVRTAGRGWSLPESYATTETPTYLAAIRATPRVCHLFITKERDEVLGTAGLLLREGFAYLVGAQVLEKARGRGLYRALVEARHAFLRARGITLAVTHARESTSAPILEKLGFETMFRSKCFMLE